MDRLTNLDAAFNPASVAIAGVGEGNAGKFYLDSLLKSGFKGRVYPVNPRGGEVSGLRVYPSVKDIPEAPDYVISCLPTRSVPQLVRDCAEKRAKVVAMFTAGFSETGRDEGCQLEDEIRRLARAGDVRLIGPNCMGAYCPGSGLSFTMDFPKESGKVALVCQSGGNTIYFIRVAAERGVRFSKAISYGNALDVDESDMFDYLAQDEETEIVTAYIEGVKDGRRFQQALGRLAARKPVIVLKGGSTAEGARTAASHTASLAGSDAVWDSLLHQAGAVRVYTLAEMVDMVVTFLFMPVPRGRRVAMVGGGGGASVLATDACARNGFTLPALPPRLADEVRGFLDTDVGLILTNPIELNMFPEVSYQIARTLIDYNGVDLMLGNCVFGQHPWPYFDVWFDLFCDVVTRVHSETDKPIAVALESDIPWEHEHFLALQRRYCQAGIPVYHSMASACRAIDRFMRYHSSRPVSAMAP
ncbi:MAG: CoA-binding protein [Chloroflexi bacterium]|nr:MAG: CoA-binding protein [Chloroflexota bacterium]